MSVFVYVRVCVCAVGMYDNVWGGGYFCTIVMVLGWGRDLKQYQNARQILR